MDRFGGPSIRDPRAICMLNVRRASFHAIWIPIHSPFLKLKLLPSSS